MRPGLNRPGYTAKEGTTEFIGSRFNEARAESPGIHVGRGFADASLVLLQ